MKVNKNRVSQRYITDRYLINDDYFSRGNKRFFNVLKTECFEIKSYFGAIIEHQGAFLEGGQSHTVLKFVSHDKKVETITSGFEGSRNGKYLFDDIIYFLKHGLGHYEESVLKKLNSIKISKDYIDTILFEAHDNTGFYLSFKDGQIKIISHK